MSKPILQNIRKKPLAMTRHNHGTAHLEHADVIISQPPLPNNLPTREFRLDELGELVSSINFFANPIGRRPNSAFHRMRLAEYHSRLALAADTTIARQTPPTTPIPGIPSEVRTLNDCEFSLIADISYVITQLMDKKEVDASTYLSKLNNPRVMLPLSRRITETLKASQLNEALDYFIAATDPAFFNSDSVQKDPANQNVYDEINHRAALLLACQNAILVAGHDCADGAVDWPPDTVVIQTQPTTPDAAQAAAATAKVSAKKTPPTKRKR